MNAGDRTLHVLIVDDSEDDAQLIARELGRAGFAVVSERVDAPQALQAALARGGWDIVLCDHNMPTLDAPSALEAVRGSGTDIPFVIVSGTIPDDTAFAAMKAGAADFVPKDRLARLPPVVERELKEAAVRADLRRAQENVRRLALHDALTGLPNSEHLFQHLGVLLENPPPDFRAALLLLDINRFSKITRTLGSTAGNRLLLLVAERLAPVFGGGDSFVARVGGDKFALLLPGAGREQQARAAAAAIHDAFAEGFHVRGHELYVTCSIGISLYPQHGTRPGDLFRRAETASYHAKGQARGNYLFYHPSMDSTGHEDLKLESALYRALRQNEFFLHYQPQINLATGRIAGLETLLRWRHSEHGEIAPARFIPVLEDTGLIVPVGQWVLRTACRQNRVWRDAGLAPVRVAVNLSAIQFRHPGLALAVEEALRESGLAPDALELEITENVAMYNEEETIATLGELKAMGVDLAIDDFGIGYSSLNYLKRFPIDRLKIDQSFIRGIELDGNAGSIVKAIIALARSLKLKVLAEGVETEEQAGFLLVHGCDEAQAYFFGRPMPGEDIARLLARGD